MTLDDVLRDIHAIRENLLVFERKYGVPTEMFYEAYRRGEEPVDCPGCWIGANGRLRTRFWKSGLLNFLTKAALNQIGANVELHGDH